MNKPNSKRESHATQMFRDLKNIFYTRHYRAWIKRNRVRAMRQDAKNLTREYA